MHLPTVYLIIVIISVIQLCILSFFLWNIVYDPVFRVEKFGKIRLSILVIGFIRCICCVIINLAFIYNKYKKIIQNYDDFCYDEYGYNSCPIFSYIYLVIVPLIIVCPPVLTLPIILIYFIELIYNMATNKYCFILSKFFSLLLIILGILFYYQGIIIAKDRDAIDAIPATPASWAIGTLAIIWGIHELFYYECKVNNTPQTPETPQTPQTPEIQPVSTTIITYDKLIN